MNMKKLLATTAIAALAATAVNAATLTYNTGAGATVAFASGDVTQSTIATEVNTATGTVSMLLTLTDPLPIVTNSVLRIELPAGFEFPTGGITAAAFQGTSAADVLDGTISFNISTGGAAAGTFVNVLISNSSVGTTQIAMNIPVKINDSACASPGQLRIGLSTDSGVPIENGGDGTNAPIVQVDGAGAAESLIACAMATTLAQTDDDGQVVGDVLKNPAFTNFVAAADVAAFASALANNTLAYSGDVLMGFNGTFTSFATTAGAAVMDETDVTSVDFSVTFADATGVDSFGLDIDADGTVDVAGTKAGNTFSFTVTGANKTLLLAAGTTHNFIVSINTITTPVVGVAAQSITMGPIVLNLNSAGAAAAAGSTMDATKTYAANSDASAFALDPFVLEADMFGPFDWVSGTGALHVFRMTGMPNATASGLVDFTNCAAGVKDQFPFTFNAPNMGEGLILSTDLETLNPGYKRCDVKFFVFDDLSSADMDRLIIAPPGSVATAYNDGANAGSSNDEKASGFGD